MAKTAPYGQRTCLVTIQAKSDSRGASKASVETYLSIVPKVWMARTPVTDFSQFSEQYRDGQVSARTFDEWEMPYQRNMDPDLVNVPANRRLSYRGRFFDIVSAVTLGEKEAIKLTTLATAGP